MLGILRLIVSLFRPFIYERWENVVAGVFLYQQSLCLLRMVSEMNTVFQSMSKQIANLGTDSHRW